MTFLCITNVLTVKIIVAVAFVAVIIVGLMVLRIVKIVYIMKKIVRASEQNFLVKEIVSRLA